jgi:hypothetical protein
MVQYAYKLIEAFKIRPPYKSLYGDTSLPPPANPNLKGAFDLIIIKKYI